MQNSDLNTNILVSCKKLETFVIQYATIHMTPKNDTEAELSIEQEEIGKTFEKAVRSSLIVSTQTLRIPLKMPCSACSLYFTVFILFGCSINLDFAILVPLFLFNHIFFETAW